jgi:predicted O-methyltransferase YrrM
MIETADTLSAKNGYLVGPEVSLLRRLAAQAPGDSPSIINIGVGTGASALALLEGNLRARVISVDNDYDALNAVRRMMAYTPYADRYFDIWSDSIEAAKSYGGEPPRMVFFDCGRHEYAYLTDEVPAWSAMCEVPWIAAFHDALQPDVPVATYSSDPPAVKAFTEVTQFVREFAERDGVKPIGHERLLVGFTVEA